MKADRIVFGVAVLAMGVIWLLVNLGVMPVVTVRELLRYWPLLLILWGLLLLAGKGNGSSGCLITLLIIVLVFGGFFAFPMYQTQVTETGSTSVPEMEGTDTIRLDLVQHAGELSIRAHGGNSYLEAAFRASPLPVVEHEVQGEIAVITIRDQADSWNISKRASHWELTLPHKRPVEMSLRTGATRAELDLSALHVTDLNIKAGAGDLVIRLGTMDSTVLVESGAGSITIYVPEETGVRLQASGGLLTVQGDNANMVSMGERRYESRDLDEKAAVADIQITAGAGSVTLRRAK